MLPGSGKISYIYLIPAFLLGGVIAFFLQKEEVISPVGGLHVASGNTADDHSCDFTVTRINDYNYIKPLLWAEKSCESEHFVALKSDWATLTDSLKKAGVIDNVSVYLREFRRGEWCEFNGGEKYHPASLMKIGVLLAYLRVTESDPALFDRKIRFEKPASVRIPAQYFSAPTIQEGNEYTVHDLLFYMAAHSDNNATWLLANRLDGSLTSKIFSNLGLPEPMENNTEFVMTARQCSLLPKAIFNSTCLNPEYSEYAAELLSNSSFKEGFARGFPKNTKMWHKFGEWIVAGHKPELHESGVIYINNTPYLMTVMTRGNDARQLAWVIQAIAKATYARIAA